MAESAIGRRGRFDRFFFRDRCSLPKACMRKNSIIELFNYYFYSDPIQPFSIDTQVKAIDANKPVG